MIARIFLSAACLVTLLAAAVRAQNDQVNIVPNPGFEEYSARPLGWFYTGQDFTRVLRYWESPTAASPDVYGPNVYVPSEWRRQGFGASVPHGGRSMVGITVYGCEGGKPHCREYIQIHLAEPLVPDQRYAFSMWVKHLPGSIQIRELGVGFSNNRAYSEMDEKLDIEPYFLSANVLKNHRDQWIPIKTEIVGRGGEEYMVIGNFFTDNATQAIAAESDQALAFGYYYVDDISLKKLPPILDIPVAEDDLSNAVLETGKTIQLNNIYFDYDRDDFLPRSFNELNTLTRIMEENPSMQIEVRGHTDNTGDKAYNDQLSLSRARAVVNYLIDHGIESYRLKSRGYGSSSPLDSNDTEEGRQQNRRVEFLILTK